MSARALRWWPAVLVVGLTGWMLALAPDAGDHLTFFHPTDQAWPVGWGWYGAVPFCAVAAAVVMAARPVSRWLGRTLGRPALATAACWLIAAGGVGNAVGATVSALVGPVPVGTADDVWHVGTVWTNPADVAATLGVGLILLLCALAVARPGRLGTTVAVLTVAVAVVAMTVGDVRIRVAEENAWAMPLLHGWPR